MRKKSSKSPKQKRSKETEQRLLSAAEAIVEEHGLAGLSIAEVVRRAGSSVGSFYGRFKDKDDLLRALHVKRIENLLERLVELENSGVFKQMDGRFAATLCMEEMVRHYTQHARLMAAFHARCAAEPEVWGDTVEAHVGLLRRLVELLLQSQWESTHPQPRKALELGLYMAFSFLGDMAIHGDRSQSLSPFQGDALASELGRMLINYVTGERV